MKNLTLKKVFAIWLTIFVVAAFVITLYFSYKIQTELARVTTLSMLEDNLADAEKRIMYSNGNLKRVKELTEIGALAKTRAFSRILINNPKILNGLKAFEEAANNIEKEVSNLSPEERADAYKKVIISCSEYSEIKQIFYNIANELSVDELVVVNGKGFLTCSYPEDYIGYDMSSQEQSKEFVKKLIDDENNEEFVQEPMPNGYSKKFFQYVGVKRKDNKGFVQIGYSPKRLEEAARIADITQISNDFRVGKSGKLRIVKNTDEEAMGYLKDNEKVVIHRPVYGQPSLCMLKKYLNLIVIASLPEDEIYASRNIVLKTMAVAYFILFSVIFVLITLLLQTVVIKGIYSVNDSLSKITEGDLNETVKVHNTKEFDSLSKGINATVNALKKAIEAESKRIDAELEIGRTIQNSVLPVDFPDNDKYAINAMMYTAKEVGGDFYDFFPIDETHNAMLIADVSGKGITAALFMMNAKALLKELVLSEKSPAVAVEKANRELCENNEARMFVTMFLAVLNTETGEMICVNAGHNPPLLYHEGKWEYLKIKHSIALGVSKKKKFVEVPIQLSHNDTFFLYTDGVTEAQNINNELYGEQRLIDFISKQKNNPKTLLENIKEDLKIFSGEAPQSDDITMIAGLYK